jgi:hypothetical protein
MADPGQTLALSDRLRSRSSRQPVLTGEGLGQALVGTHGADLRIYRRAWAPSQRRTRGSHRRDVTVTRMACLLPFLAIHPELIGYLGTSNP